MSSFHQLTRLGIAVGACTALACAARVERVDQPEGCAAEDGGCCDPTPACTTLTRAPDGTLDLDAGSPCVGGIPIADGSPPEPLFGVADLHIHPAIHLGYGGDEDGFGGLIWGGPFANTDLAPPTENFAFVGSCPVPDQRPREYTFRATPCDPEIHDLAEPDPIRRATRTLVLALLASGGSHFPHTDGRALPIVGTEGYTDPFPRWPHGSSPSHQAVHVEALRRAYDGGLRLIVAAVDNAQTIARIADVRTFPGSIHVSREYERESAIQQLEMLHRLAAANSSWMEIVTSSEQAERAIREERLAVVLSIELDAIRVEDMEDLYHRYGVRHVTPIHFTDNDFGGVATYGSVFNTNASVMRSLFGADTAEFYHVEGDAQYALRVGRPLNVQLFPDGIGVFFFPDELPWDPYLALGYEAYGELAGPVLGGVVPIPRTMGHRNVRGVQNEEAFRRLMRLGMLIDLSHMGDRTTGDLLELACDDDSGACTQACSYPLHYSHGGIRWDGSDDPDQSGGERDLHARRLRRMLQLGPTAIGIGTSPQGRPVDATIRAYERGRGDAVQVRLDHRHSSQTIPLTVLPGPRSRFDAAPAAANWLTDGHHRVEVRVSAHDARERRSETVWCSAYGETGAFVLSDCSPPGAPRVGVTDFVDSVLVQAWHRRENTCTRADCRAEPGVNGTGVVAGTITVGGSSFEIALDHLHGAQSFSFRARAGRSLAALSGPHQRTARIRIVSGATSLRTTAYPLDGTNVCVSFAGMEPTAAQEGGCERGELSMNGGGAWARNTEVTAVVRVSETAELPTEVSVRLQVNNGLWDAFEVAQVHWEEIEDPVAEIAFQLRRLMDEVTAAGFDETGIGGFGSDLNSLQESLPFSRVIDQDVTDLVVSSAQGPARRYRVGPLSVDAPNDGVDATRIRLDERGFASVGLYPELFAAVRAHAAVADEDDDRVLNSIFRSAERFIAHWRAVERRSRDCRY